MGCKAATVCEVWSGENTYTVTSPHTREQRLLHGGRGRRRRRRQSKTADRRARAAAVAAETAARREKCGGKRLCEDGRRRFHAAARGSAVSLAGETVLNFYHKLSPQRSADTARRVAK